MINPESIDLNSLSSLPLSDHSSLPGILGIYFAVDSLGSVQYIGRSVNLRQRWVNHHRHNQLNVHYMGQI